MPFNWWLIFPLGQRETFIHQPQLTSRRSSPLQSMNFYSYNKFLKRMKAVIFRLTFILLISSGHGMKNPFFIPLTY